MKLYFAPGACSLSPHIVSREAGIDLDLEQVDNREKKTKTGQDFWRINPKGQVPVLEIDDGQRLTEGPVIVQYLADQKPASGLVPPAGSLDRAIAFRNGSTSSHRNCIKRTARYSGRRPPKNTRRFPRKISVSAWIGSMDSLPASNI